jgi:hypothetical protein
MISRRIIVLSAAAVALFGYFIFFKDRNDLIIYFSLSLVILVIAYVFQFQLDQIVTRGAPLKLDSEVRDMLLSTAPHFRTMTTGQQLLMEDRMRRWIIKKDFINKNEQDAPEDSKFILAYYAILLTMHQKSFDYDGLDRVVFYHHPFLSPQFPDDVHIAEVEIEDGTMIVSVPHLLKGHFEKGFYNIGLHLMAEAYHHLYVKDQIQWSDDIWSVLESISTIPKISIDNYIGIPVSNPWPVAVHHQVMYRDVQIFEVTSHLPQFAHVKEIPV